MKGTFLLVVVSLALQVPVSQGFVAPRQLVHPKNRSSTFSSSSPRPSLASTRKFEELRNEFPSNVNVVKAGGWDNLRKYSEDPKGELVRTIMTGLIGAKGNVENELTSEKLEALVTLMQSKNRGFEADLVNGEWAIVFIRQGNKSPSFQKAVGKKEKAGLSMNVFNIKDMTFTGEVKLLKKGIVSTKVKYDPVIDAYTVTSKGKIVLRRIMCDIVEAGFKFWKLPRLPLPFLKRKGGYLDFVYMDDDIRITKGSRGGLFVHFRPKFLEEQLELFDSSEQVRTSIAKETVSAGVNEEEEGEEDTSNSIGNRQAVLS